MLRRTTWTHLTLLLGATLHGQSVTPKEHAEALKDLAKAETVDAFLAAEKPVLEGDDARSVRSVVAAYSKFFAGPGKKLDNREFMTFHGKAASAFGAVKSKGALDEMKKLLVSHGEWHGRLLLVDASGVAKGSDRLDACLVAIRDAEPAVVRRALGYLRHSEKVQVVEAIVGRYVELSKKSKSPQVERTLLGFQSTLSQMLKVDLPAPEDYKNYFEARKSDPNLFHPEKSMGAGASGVTLFGAAVTGKNIAFVLDISGSMLTTDPPPPGQAKEQTGTTGVGGDTEGPQARRKPKEDRQRITRAKKELSNVVRAIPSDVRFNLIVYSSDVNSWKKAMVQATDANKKSAVEYIETLKPEGVTVTDAALEEAFADLDLDTIYLVTDGAPTHIGSLSPGLPEDTPELIERIHERVKELNFLRGVRIFTLGFREAHEGFLKKLAADNGGKYVAIQ